MFAYLSNMNQNRCVVAFTDTDRIVHQVEVWTSTVYEAVGEAVREFRAAGITKDLPGLNTELSIAVHRQPVTHKLQLRQVTQWAAGGRKSPRDLLERKRIRHMLGTDKQELAPVSLSLNLPSTPIGVTTRRCPAAFDQRRFTPTEEYPVFGSSQQPAAPTCRRSVDFPASPSVGMGAGDQTILVATCTSVQLSFERPQHKLGRTVVKARRPSFRLAFFVFHVRVN